MITMHTTMIMLTMLLIAHIHHHAHAHHALHACVLLVVEINDKLRPPPSSRIQLLEDNNK
jgi:hypothetical protein